MRIESFLFGLVGEDAVLELGDEMVDVYKARLR